MAGEGSGDEAVPDREDRFGDLGAPPADRAEAEEVPSRAPGEQSAAERLAELDTEPEPGAKRPEPARPSGRYMWVVGAAAILALIVLGVQAIPNRGAALRGVPAGEGLPEFAAPSATGDTEGDANIRQVQGGSEGEGARPACEVRGPDIVNLCELRDRPLVLSFIVTQGTNCEPQLDSFTALADELPEVNFAAVVSGLSRSDVEKLARERRWDFPVAVDRDGAVVNLYRVGVCPTTTFAYAGGKVRETKLGALEPDEIRAAARAIQDRPR